MYDRTVESCTSRISKGIVHHISAYREEYLDTARLESVSET